MNRIAFVLITIFLGVEINFQLFSQPPQDEDNMRRSSKYPGLIFWIDEETYRSYWVAYKEYGKNWNGMPNLQFILDNMENCFNEAVAYYEENKKELPSCLKNCLGKLLEELKKPGPTILNCTWYKDKNVPWPFVYKQRFDLVEAEENGMSTKKQYIYLINVWQKTFEYIINKENNRPVMTSSILLHELIHCVKKHYPDCFKGLDRPKEEGTTEDGTVKIYSEENCTTSYKDRYGWNSKCIYENVCNCDCSAENFD